MSSLVQLAARKTLPNHQFIDVETLNWIKANNPFTEFNSQITPPLYDTTDIFNILNKCKIDHSWFNHDEAVNSIHGIRHLLRVATNGLNLLKYGLGEQQYKNIILIASLCHDIKRETDKSDPNHGKRSAIWFKKNLKSIEKTFITLNRHEVDNVFYAIYYHETELSELVHLPEYQSHKYAIDLLKIADALDRYRLPKLKWWINDDLLPLAPPMSAKYFAYKLVIESENNYLQGNSSYNSVLSAIQKYATLKKT